MKSKTYTIAIPIMLGLLGGCALDGSEPKDFIPPPDASRSVNQMIAVQSTLGAVEDATLQECHFTGGKLNSLGEAKLEMLVPADLEGNVVLYLNVASDTAAARKDAVSSFLGAHGVGESHLKIEAGTNPKLATPSAAGLAALPRTDSGGGTVSDSGQPSSGGMGGDTGTQMLEMK